MIIFALKSSGTGYNLKQEAYVNLSSFKQTLWHLNWMTKFFLVISIMVMSAMGALMIRLQKGPWDLDFAKQKIEHILNNSGIGYTITIGKAYLIWPEVAAPLMIDLDNLQIATTDNQTLIIPDFKFSISGMALLKGKIRPSLLILDQPTIKLLNDDGSFNRFSLIQKKTPQQEVKQIKEIFGPFLPSAPDKNIPVESAAINFEQLRQDIQAILSQIVFPDTEHFTILSDLKKIHIRNASLLGKNGENDVLGTITLLLQRTSLGLTGELSLAGSINNEQETTPRFRSDIVYRRKEKDLTFTATLQNLHSKDIKELFPDIPLLEKQDLLLSGDVRAAFDKDLLLQGAAMNLNLPEGTLDMPDIFSKPLALKEVALKAGYNHVNASLDVSDFMATIEGIPVHVTTSMNLKDKTLIKAPIEMKISELKLEQIPVLFPKSHIESSAGEWLTKRLSKGILKDIQLNTDFIVQKDNKGVMTDMAMTNVVATFKGEGLSVRYSDSLMPATDVIAHGKYENDTLEIWGSKAHIKDVISEDVYLKLSDLSVIGAGMAELKLKAKGPFKTVLDYVSDEPIEANLGFDTKNVQGDVAFDLDLTFPTLKELPKDKVTVVVDGTLNNLLLPEIVSGLPLIGGPYELSFSKGLISLKGKGKFADRDIDVNYSEYMDATGKEFESKIVAKIVADDGLRQAMGIDLTDFMQGPVLLDITYLDTGSKAAIEVKGDTTTADLFFKPMAYLKSAGQDGTLSLTAHMDKDDVKEVTNLNVEAQGLKLSGGKLVMKRLADGSTDVASGTLPNLELNKTKASIGFERVNPNLLNVNVTADSFDMTPFLSTTKAKADTVQVKESSIPTHITLKTQKLVGEEGESLSNATFYVELDKEGDPTLFDLTASMGANKITANFKPDGSGMRRFVLNTDNAGQALKIFGLYKNMQGGTMAILGNPQSFAKKDLIGNAQIDNFTIRKAPALAKLLSVSSVKGINNVLGDEGIQFAKLKSDFEWRFHENGNLLVVKEGRTSGNQLGLTFEGVVNMGTNTTDISGTIIPLSNLNKAVGKIPLIGDILTGGDALFAATYGMKGDSDDPAVTINPLSVLAPGFLRKILFEGDVEQKIRREEVLQEAR